MNQYLLPILAVVIGFLIMFFWKPKNQKSIKILLSFSGGFLLATTAFNLIPEVFSGGHDHHLHHSKQLGLFIVIGVLVQIFLEYFSKGAEHGHVHHNEADKKFPWVLFLSLFIHAFLEGFPVHQTHGMLTGIIVHKMPVALILATFLFKSEVKNSQILIFMLLFAAATPLGTFMASKFSWATLYYKQISALVIGIFLHISTTILFESSEGHKYNLAKMSAIICAITLAYFV